MGRINEKKRLRVTRADELLGTYIIKSIRDHYRWPPWKSEEAFTIQFRNVIVVVVERETVEKRS